MVQEEELSEVLSDFARTLITDFPIQGILDHLVARIVDVLPVTAVGVTLITEGMAPRYVAASDASALRYERLQTEKQQGPCISAFTSGEAVSVPDWVWPRCSRSRYAMATSASVHSTSTATPPAGSNPTTCTSRRRSPTSRRPTC